MQVSSVFNAPLSHAWIYAVDVRAKMFICILASVMSIIISNFTGQMVLVVASFCYVLSLRRIRTLLIAYVLVFMMTLLALGCFRLMAFFMPRLAENFELTAMLVPFLRILVMLHVILPLALSSRVQTMLHALRSLRLPFCIYLPTAVAFRFLPAFQHDIKQVAESLRIRGYRVTPWSLTRHPLLSLRLLFTPLLFRSLRSSEDLGIAAELKGLGCVRRITPYCTQSWKKTDFFLIGAAVLTSVAAVACQLCMGGKNFMS